MKPASTYGNRIRRLEEEIGGLEKKAGLERIKAAKERQGANRRRSQIRSWTSDGQRVAKEQAALRGEQKALEHEFKAAVFAEEMARKGDQLRRTNLAAQRAQEKALPPLKEMRKTKKFDFCLSFAGEQRPYVERVAHSLKGRGYRVFYDADEDAELLGKNLEEHFDYVFRRASRACVMFISREYAEKKWTKYERRSALARALEEDEYVLPARFDDTELPGLHPTVGYVDLRRYTSDELVDLLARKLGRPTRA
jgi:hypothetical protein